MYLHKSNPVRSKQLRDSAEDQSCIRCGINDGTVVLAHYTGLRQHQYGKGRGVKGSDMMGAHLCLACHVYFDEPARRKCVEASEEFLHCIALTWERWRDMGLISIKGVKAA